MPCMKRVCRDKLASVYWSADSNEERSWSRWYTAGQPVMNRLSTADFVPPPLYIGFPLFVLAKNRSGQLSSKPWEARGTVGLWADRTVGTLFCPAPPRPAARAPRRPDPPEVCPGFGFDKLFTFGFDMHQIYRRRGWVVEPRKLRTNMHTVDVI